MGKLETIMKSEIERLAKRELHKVSVPLKRDVRSLKITVSQLRKAILPLQRFTEGQQKELAKREVELEVSPEEIKKSRFSPRLVKTLRKKLKITQKELAILAGVSMQAVPGWEAGKFTPKAKTKATLAGLRKLGRTEVKKLLAEKAPGIPKQKRIKTKSPAKKEKIMPQKKAVKKVAKKPVAKKSVKKTGKKGLKKGRA